MFRRILPLLLLLAACQATPSADSAPTLIPFPTVTVGRSLIGALPLSDAPSNLPNPATAVALANQPTATPDYAACPNLSETTLSPKPASGRAMADEITRYLSDGGTAVGLEAGLRDDWQGLGETGFVRADLDLTGEGVPEIIAAYTAPEEVGHLLIWGCANGGYGLRYQAAGSGSLPPEVVATSDLNFDRLPDMLFTDRQCDADDNCRYQTQAASWQPQAGRFTNLLASAITSDVSPEPRDIDNDSVLELVVRLEDDGSASTGPLRTGVNIYDWNGSVFVLSIVQFDPPRFTIQVIHEADRALAARDSDKAITLYETALSDTTLDAWYNNDPAVLPSYVQYRLLLAYAFADDPRLLDHYQTIVQAYPDPAARPVYALLSDTFWNGFQVTNNLHSACLEVLDVITQQPDALELLNRYGSRSPTYTPQDLCPF